MSIPDIIDINDTPLVWSDGSTGAIKQEYPIQLDAASGDTFVLHLSVERKGHPTVDGRVRITSEALDNFGQTNAERSPHLGRFLAAFFGKGAYVPDFDFVVNSGPVIRATS